MLKNIIKKCYVFESKNGYSEIWVKLQTKKLNNLLLINSEHIFLKN